MKKIAIIGECMIELNGEPFGAMTQTFGGDTLNAAVYLQRAAKAPLNVHFVSAMGSDALSQEMIKRWQDEGISTELVLTDNKRSPGLYLIQLDAQGERTFLYWRNQSAAKYLFQHPDFEQVAQSLREMDMLFLSGISLAILEPQDREKLIVLLAELAEQGVEIAFDSNYRPALWPDDECKTVRQVYSAILPLCSLALLTFDDEQLIWSDSHYGDTLARLYAAGTKKTVIKLGSRGCVYSELATNSVTEVTTEVVEHVVDTTSAGDSFNGGFLAAYLEGEEITAACQRGNALAGVVIQHAGAIVPKAITESLF